VRGGGTGHDDSAQHGGDGERPVRPTHAHDV
jgi:hypothetical protein